MVWSYHHDSNCQGGITCGAIDEPRKSSKAIDERVIINFRDKNVVIARMFGVFAIDEILRYRGTRFPGSRTLCHPVCEWQRLIIAGDWINVCGWTECRDLGRADVYFQALTAGPWFIQCLHTAKQIEQSHQKLPQNMLACQISLNRTQTDSLTSVSQMVLGCSPKTLRKYFLVRSLSMKLNIII